MRFRAPPRPDPELLGLFEESGRNIQRAALMLRAMLAEFPDQMNLAHDLLVCEQEGDRIAHDILHRLAIQNGRRAAYDSVDVRALVGALDDVVDFAEEAADQLGVYGVEAPMECAEQLAGVLVECAERVAVALRGLRSEADLSPQLVDIHRLENDGDRLLRAGIADLFRTGIDPMVVIRWKDILETLEQAVDACERVANVLEGMTLKRSHT